MRRSLIRIRATELGAAALLVASAAWSQNHGYGFGGRTFGEDVPGGASRYGIGGSWAIAPRVTAGGEIGGIHKSGSGKLASANVGLHFRRDVESGVDPFVTGGITGVRIGGETGLYGNPGAGANYWVHRRLGIRGEFRGYPGGRDLNSFSEIRLGVCFR